MDALTYPALITSNLRRLNWSTHRETQWFALQSHQPRANKPLPVYRIISRKFPHYRVAAHDDYATILAAWEFLNSTVLDEMEGKVTSKKIVKFLRLLLPKNGGQNAQVKAEYESEGEAEDSAGEEESPDDEPEVGPSDPESLMTTDGSVLNQPSSNASLGNIHSAGHRSRHGPSKLAIAISEESMDFTPHSDDEDEDLHESEFAELCVTSHQESDSSKAAHPSLLPPGGSLLTQPDSSNQDNLSPETPLNFLTWFEWLEPSEVGQKKEETKGLFDRINDFVELVILPKIEPGKRPSYQLLREYTLVRQRRRVLLMFTLFILLIRFSSFDFFLVILILSNAALLYFMKNSRKLNVQLAKRSVRQRVGWAKQYMGAFFRRGTSDHNAQSNGSGNGNDTNSNVDTEDMSASEGKRRRRIFGRKKSNVNNIATNVNGTTPSPGTSPAATPPPNETKKRSFFRRAQSNSNASNASTASHTPTTSADHGTLSSPAKTAALQQTLAVLSSVSLNSASSASSGPHYSNNISNTNANTNTNSGTTGTSNANNANNEHPSLSVQTPSLSPPGTNTSSMTNLTQLVPPSTTASGGSPSVSGTNSTAPSPTKLDSNASLSIPHVSPTPIVDLSLTTNATASSSVTSDATTSDDEKRRDSKDPAPSSKDNKDPSNKEAKEPLSRESSRGRTLNMVVEAIHFGRSKSNSPLKGNKEGT